MKLLAMDTSNQTLAVAVLEDEKVLAHFQLNRKMNHSLTLMPAIESVMQASGLTPADLDRIVVAKGPGSYTGIRIAVTTAKTLAETLKIQLTTVSSLAVIAGNVQTEKVIIPLIDARRNNVYAGAYRWEQGKLVSVMADQHMSLTDLLQKIQEPAFFVGETAKFKQEINAAWPTAEVSEADEQNLPSGIVLGKLGFLAKPVDDIHGLVPEYLKRVEAEEKWLETHQPEDEDYVEKI
ncbi:tRNA (adenosine(37)-N6)-threonylcarbamoyltransferase complex dimerization subunit type 1 TsaB [Enterococcus gilvus]|jgi:tRNA threonylcarbamoyladenosine biosynthesis protein TsaB|uniref:tRNA (adenosine(37)-N6)-threonylcarbamoyltransferase complex dimerization subunit type 1 TsaB n=1 Tax=Enterococcus gilvus TaxID=160453 RepID=UPI000DF603A4|nr:tRNA (adenosine(37)-N6)-threonylcarbamoyltransferase complex dimerization subunit type 1 TsaB [Enterococcus gilvus]AXG38571.1 tRNA (adenosine(37)-N6)-threonylcarbamoyltransferase complex dimerization subunit type 1 TsaB [Enterococcus gilvus]MDU5510121.1 tRNA (adenosine(37)-N6)-threonylcarbamoyltransferase complex dimerization subunit type 1 TsaB [Enterococcus gilvus]